MMPRKALTRILIVSGLLIGVGLLGPPLPYAQNPERLLLSFSSELSYTQPGPYGPAGVTVRSEGYAFLVPKARAQFMGSGQMKVTMTFSMPPNPAIGISPLEGFGDFQVGAERQGKELLFWFEKGDIPCKGKITVTYPAPMGMQTEPYEDHFDPHTLAPGDPGVWKIPFRDGAEKTVTYEQVPPMKGRTTFMLDNAEIWRVGVQGKETDDTAPLISNSRLKNESKELAISMTFDWTLTAEFVIIGKGSSRSFYDGDVMTAQLTPSYNFDHWDLYRCEEYPCKQYRPISGLQGAALNGKVLGGNVRLIWPVFHSVACVVCTPKKSYLGRLRYRHTFGTQEFLARISREELPLIDGTVLKGTHSDWMTFTITLHMIK